MILNITAPTTIDKIKWNMFLTNEYGKPSMEWLDNFIDNFSGSLINGNFVITENHKEVFDKLWSAIEQDLDERNLTGLAHNNYGWYFYRQLSEDCNNKIKSADELRVYLLNYTEEQHQHLIKKEPEENIKQATNISDIEVSNEVDKDIKDDTVLDVESILDKFDTQDSKLDSYEDNTNTDIEESISEMSSEINFDITPELIHTDKDGRFIYVTKETPSNYILAQAKYYENGKTVLMKYSKVGKILGCATPHLISERQNAYNKGIINDAYLIMENIEFDSCSGAGKFVTGRTNCGYYDWLNKYDNSIGIYSKDKKIKYELKKDNIEDKDSNSIYYYRLKRDIVKNMLSTLPDEFEIKLEHKDKDTDIRLILATATLDVGIDVCIINGKSISFIDVMKFEDFIYNIMCNKDMLLFNYTMDKIKHGEMWKVNLFGGMKLNRLYDYTED